MEDQGIQVETDTPTSPSPSGPAAGQQEPSGEQAPSEINDGLEALASEPDSGEVPAESPLEEQTGMVSEPQEQEGEHEQDSLATAPSDTPQPYPSTERESFSPDQTDTEGTSLIEESDYSPETVLATVNSEDILFQDLYEEFNRLPPDEQNRLRNRLHKLLEEMIKKELIIQKAHEKDIVYSERYQQNAAELEASPEGDNMDDEEIKQTALIGTFIEELTSELSFPDEKLISFFEKHEHNMPENADYETLKPHIEQLLVNEYIEEYIQELDAEANIDVNHKWLAQKLEEAPLKREGDAQEVP